MATLAPNVGAGRRRKPSLVPDVYERVLSAGALILLLAVLVALWRGRADFGAVPTAVWPHLLTIVVAVSLTPVLLLGRRGSPGHRTLGTVWVVSMLATAVSSFFIRQVGHGGFSLIHLLSVFTLI